MIRNVQNRTKTRYSLLERFIASNTKHVVTITLKIVFKNIIYARYFNFNI